MKIAIASEGRQVSEHFGHCRGFEIYEIEGSKIEDREFIENPGHKPGFLPVFLKDLNVDMIIAGGMGERAQQLFNECGLEVIIGAQGLPDKIIQEYIEGNLESTGDVCKEHAHEGDCGE